MIDFNDKIVSAPMVRISSLPFRLLCLKYGCDLVYTEEIIDYKLVKSKRYKNESLGTIDFIDDENNLLFRTCDLEKGKVILQIGTNDPDRALKAAKIVEKDVAAIDVNMGCPKSFSLKGGMGSALLSNKEKVKDILINLVQNLDCPVTCKIRVLPKLEDTLDLVKLIENTGVSAIAVHGRTKDERPRHENRIDFIKSIVNVLKIPVIANGNSGKIKNYEDILTFKQQTNASSVMIARAAETNFSIFCKNGKLDIDNIIEEYLDLSIKYDSFFTNVKYAIQNILGSLQETTRGRKFLASSTLREICELWNKADDYDLFNENLLKDKSNNDEINVKTKNDKKICVSTYPLRRKRKLNDDQEVDEMCLKFIRNLFEKDHHLPKTILLNYANKINKKAIFNTFQIEKLFYCICELDGKKYINSFLEKNKKFAIQGTSLVACSFLKLIDDDIIKKSKFEKKSFQSELLEKIFC